MSEGHGSRPLLQLDPGTDEPVPGQGPTAFSRTRVQGPRHRSSRREREPRPGPRHAVHHDGMLRFSLLSVLALVPGVGLIAAGRKIVGALVLLPVVLLALFGLAVVLDRPTREWALGLTVRPDALVVLAVLAVVAGLVWVASIALTGWAARPSSTTPLQRAGGVALVAVLAAAVAVPDSFATRYALIQRDVVQTLFEDDASAAPQPGVAKPTGQTRADPWASTPRVNMLLLGSDAGTDRTGVRTDSMMVASIDTKTGRTVLLSLPRNLQRVPFPSSNPLHRLWPNGYDCGSECLLNAVWTEADNHKDLFPGVRSPGLETVRGVIGEVLGLRIDYTTIIDLKGFSGLVDAMGGVVVDVPRRIPIGGGHNQATGAALPITGWIEPGTQRLTGYRALWFSRSREGSDDYDRMRRQRCMVGALLDQSNPATLLARYPRLAKVLQRNLSTDVPRSDLPAWVTLVQRVQGGGVSSLPFTSDVISTVHPDFTHIRELVQKAVTKVPKKGKKKKGAKDDAEAVSIDATC
ncbi:LCP family protein [Angustibacter aerolatus]